MTAAIRPEEWRNLVVVCSGMAWDGPKLSERQLVDRLSQYAPVLYVEPPISVLTPLRRPEYRAALKQPRLRQVAPRTMCLTPVVLPGVGRPVARDLAIAATRLAIRRATRQLGGDVAAMVVGSLDGLFGAAGERRRVLWGTDDFSAGGELMGVSPDWLKRRELAQLQRADIVCAVSQPLAAKWRAMSDRHVEVIHNGCDVALFAGASRATRPADLTLPAPIALYAGHLSDRIDLSLLEAVADTGVSLLLVGARQRTFDLSQFELLLARPNVQWVGAKEFTELRGYFGAASVGLTPYALSDFNRASFPLKTLDYLAAGLPVASSAIPASDEFSPDVVRVARSSRDYGALVRELARSATPELRRQAVAEARAHDWNARARDFSELLGLTATADESPSPVIAERSSRPRGPVWDAFAMRCDAGYRGSSANITAWSVKRLAHSRVAYFTLRLRDGSQIGQCAVALGRSGGVFLDRLMLLPEHGDLWSRAMEEVLRLLPSGEYVYGWEQSLEADRSHDLRTIHEVEVTAVRPLIVGAVEFERWDSWESYYSSISTNVKRNVQKAKKTFPDLRLAERHGLSSVRDASALVDVRAAMYERKSIRFNRTPSLVSTVLHLAANRRAVFVSTVVSAGAVLSAFSGLRFGRNTYYLAGGSAGESRGASWLLLTQMLQQAYEAGPDGRFVMGYADLAIHDERISGGLLRMRRSCRVTDFPTSIVTFTFRG